MAERPILIDEKDGPCEICAAWDSLPNESKGGRLWRYCGECKEPIGLYQNMNGAGFRSPKPHHWHIELIVTTHGGDDFAARRPHYAELCLDCYWQACEKAGLPFPQAPMELVQPEPPSRHLQNDQHHGDQLSINDNVSHDEFVRIKKITTEAVNRANDLKRTVPDNE